MPNNITPTHDRRCLEHRVVRELVDDIDLEAVILRKEIVSDERSDGLAVRALGSPHTLFPTMRGPGVPPLATTAARANPSGETVLSVMTRFATGPMAACVPAARVRAKRGVDSESFTISYADR